MRRAGDFSPSDHREGFRSVVFALFLIAATILAYAPAILRGGFVFDDSFNVTDNLLLRSVSGLISIWTKVGPARGGAIQYYPLTYTVFWIEFHLWQLLPMGYHLVNVLLHALSAVLVLRMLRRLRVPGAFLAAAIFALHPVHVESVAWVTELKNVLAVFFYLAALSCYLRFLGFTETEREVDGEKPAFYFLAVLLFLCALASKTIAGTLPAAILLILWWKNGRIAGRELLLMSPMLILGAGAGLLTAHVEKYQAGAQGHEWLLTPMERLLLAARVPWFYATKLVWPTKLAVIYSRWDISQADWRQYLFLPATIAAIAIFWNLQRRLGRGPLAAVLFFGGTLVPAMGFANVYFMRYSYVADHFQYPASLGLIVLFSVAAARVYQELKSRTGFGFAKRAAPTAAVMLLSVLGLLTWRQCRGYESDEKLWTDTVEKTPSSWMAQNNLGYHLNEDGKYQEAEEHLAVAVRLKGDYGDAHNNLGIALVRQGKIDEAAAQYRQAIAYAPGDVKARCNLGEILAYQGRLDEAIAQYRLVLDAAPDFAVARRLLDAAVKTKSRTQERRLGSAARP